MDIKEQLAALEPDIYSVFCKIHENPELGMQEFQTSALLEREILEHGDCDELKHIGPTGLIAVLRGEKKGEDKCLLLRGELDALPITEDADHAVRSKNEGVMHACGHDAHASILLGTLRLLKQYKKHFAGTIYFFFQPAEETLDGAKLLLETKEIDLSEIQGVAACHIIPDLYAGDIGLKAGAMLASADHFIVRVKGSGGHGAHPYTTVDPIVTACGIVGQLQNIVAREVNALDSAVLSVCSIHSEGDSVNIIPDSVTIKGTIRALKKDTRKLLREQLVRVCKGVSLANRAEAEVEIIEGPPPFCNDADWVERTKIAAGKLLGEKHVKMLDVVTMGAEDFAFIKDRYPGVFVRIGCRTRGKEFTPIHSGRLTVDRSALTAGMLTLSSVAMDFFDIDEKLWLKK